MKDDTEKQSVERKEASVVTVTTRQLMKWRQPVLSGSVTCVTTRGTSHIFDSGAKSSLDQFQVTPATAHPGQS